MKRGLQHAIKRLKAWDLRTAGRVDHFVAISEHIRKRIKTAYQREADVIYPPVDTDYFTPDPAVPRENFYLIVSALVPYKKIEMAVQSFNELGLRLMVIGEGPEAASLKRAAKKNIEFLGWQSNAVVRDHYRRARALIFPGEEDFGIVPVEMQACGGPVIAYGKGGALETVQFHKTGLFFNEPRPESLKKAVIDFDQRAFLAEDSRKNALRFSRQRFQMEISEKFARLAGQKKVYSQ